MIGSLGSIAIWVLMGISVALLVAIGLTLNSYREMRRTPYYFQKKQATQRVQNYTLTSVTLLIAAGVVAVYAYSPALNDQPQTRLISNAKPLVSDVETTTLSQLPEVEDQQDDNIAQRIIQSSDERLSQATSVETENTTLAATLPDEYYTISAESTLPDGATIQAIRFATDVEEFEPIGVSSEFTEGNFTLYAAFDYTNLTDGLAWSWVWKRNGNIIGGGEQMWEYGNTGPGYIYYHPPTGFSPGDYTLEFWLNGKLVNKSNLSIINSVTNR